MEQVNVRDLKICCECVGNGYPIVLIMGLTANMDWWDPKLVDALDKTFALSFILSIEIIEPNLGFFWCIGSPICPENF